MDHNVYANVSDPGQKASNRQPESKDRKMSWIAVLAALAIVSLVSLGVGGAAIAKVFPGNRDRNSYKINIFPQPITAQYFRITVVAWSTWPTMRMEFISC